MPLAEHKGARLAWPIPRSTRISSHSVAKLPHNRCCCEPSALISTWNLSDQLVAAPKLPTDVPS